MPLKAHQYCSDKLYEASKYYWSWFGSVYTMCVQVRSVAQSCLTLWDPTDCSPPGSSVQGIFPARMLEWVAISSSRGSSLPRGRTCISCIGRWFFTTESPGKFSHQIIYFLFRDIILKILTKEWPDLWKHEHVNVFLVLSKEVC